MRSLGLDGLAVRGHEHARHQAEGTEALRDGIRLHVAVVVLAGPDVAAVPLERGCDHVVDETVLVGEAFGFVLVLVLLFEHLGEDVLEPSVIGLEDRVLRAQVHRVVAHQAIVEACAGETGDGIVEVVLHLRHTGTGVVVHHVLDRFGTVLRGEGDGEAAGAGHAEVRRLVLVAERVAGDNDRLGPAGHQARDVGDNDRLTEDRAAEDIPDGPVGGAVHALESEFLDSCLVRRDCGALDAHVLALDRLRRVDRHLVVGGVAVEDAQIVVIQVDVQVGEDEPVLDLFPDHAGHLIAVKFDDGALDCNLRHAFLLGDVQIRMTSPLWSIPVTDASLRPSRRVRGPAVPQCGLCRRFGQRGGVGLES